MIQMRGQVAIDLVEPGTGRVVAQHQAQNMVVDQGLFVMTFGLSSASAAPPFGVSTVHIGTDSTAVARTDVYLGANHASVTPYQYSRSGGVVTIRAFFRAASSSVHIREVGAMSGYISYFIARAIVNVDNSAGLYDVRITWQFTIGRA